MSLEAPPREHPITGKPTTETVTHHILYQRGSNKEATPIQLKAAVLNESSQKNKS